MDKIKLSIITVCFNSIATIEQSIKSVINQSYDNFEYIIIDGGSTDGTIDIIKKYESGISYWSSEKDSGIYDAMNKGIKKATGDIVAFLNSDDYYINNTVLDQVAFYWLKNGEMDILAGRISICNRFSIFCGYSPEVTDLESLCYRMVLDHPAIFSRRELFETDGLFDLQYQLAADYAWILQEYHKHRKIVTCNDVFTVFRLGGASCIQTQEIALEVKRIAECINPICYYERYKEKINEQFGIRQKQVRRSKRINEILTIEKERTLQKVNQFINSAEVAIWGYGYFGQECHEILAQLGVSINLIIDNDKKKWQCVENISISGIEALKNFSGVIILSPYGYEDEIKKQIESQNFPSVRTVNYSDILNVLDVDMY